ncbi:MAG: Rrf2 family transcriptional regulator [Acetobacter sp.]|nr:Rrf2 family transcriptional regulator [Acetobacter sp.]
MKISTKGRYGWRILLDLALYGETPRLMREIAASQGISEKYISRLIVPLNKAGFVRSIRGVKGGFVLAKSPADITLLAVVEAMEGRVAVVECVTDKAFCAKSNDCSACEMWTGLSAEIRQAMAKVTLADLVATERFRQV